MSHNLYKQNAEEKNRDYKAALGIDHCDHLFCKLHQFKISGHDFMVIYQLSKINKYE